MMSFVVNIFSIKTRTFLIIRQEDFECTASRQIPMVSNNVQPYSSSDFHLYGSSLFFDIISRHLKRLSFVFHLIYANVP